MLNDLLQFKKIKEGDIETFEKVFRQYYLPLLYFSAGITGRIDVAEEIIQDLFYTIWKERGKIFITSSLKSYLYSSVKNRSLQFCIRDKREKNYTGYTVHNTTSAQPENTLEYKELEEILKNVIKRMPQRRRTIFSMHRFHNTSYKDIAHHLSVSVKTIEAEMTKALKDLKKETDNYFNKL